MASPILSSGGGELPEIPFDIIQEVDLDDPRTWTPPPEVMLNLGFTWWYRQRPNPNYPASMGGQMYLGKVEGSILRLPARAAQYVWDQISGEARNLRGSWDRLLGSTPGVAAPRP